MVSLDLLTSLFNCKTNSKPQNRLFRELASHVAHAWRVVVYNFQRLHRLLRLLEITETPSMPKYEIVQEEKKQKLNNTVKLNEKSQERVQQIQSAGELFETTSDHQLEKALFS